jgi:hypothetical protein
MTRHPVYRMGALYRYALNLVVVQGCDFEPGVPVAEVARIALDDGGWLLVETDAGGASAGPVKAGRMGDALGELPANLSIALAPVTTMARTVLEELKRAGPDQVEVEFGVNLAVQAGVLITKGEGGCHLKVTMHWSGDASVDERR